MRSIATVYHAVCFFATRICRHATVSFVLVVKGIDADDFPDELNIVPTLIEANDILEMDNIERDLGF